MKLKKLWLYILTPLLVLLGSVTLTNTVQAQELKNVITNVQVWDVDNGKLKEPDTNGVYDLAINKTYSNYKYMVNFDLSQYNGQFADGQDDQYTYSSSKEFDLNKNHKDQIVNGGWHKNLKKITLKVPITKILGLPKVNPDEMRETLSYLVNDAPKEWTFNFKIEALSENKEVEKEEQKSFTLENKLKEFAEDKELLYEYLSQIMNRNIGSLDELSDEEVGILYNKARVLLWESTQEESIEYTYEIPEGEIREFTFRVRELSSNYTFVKNDRYNERYHYFKYDGQNEYNSYYTVNTNYEDRKELTEELIKKIWETNLGEDVFSYTGSRNRGANYENNLDLGDYEYIKHAIGVDSRGIYHIYPFINSILKQPWTPMEPPVREINVKKEFKASNGEAIKSPVDEIEVELYKNGEATGNKLTLSAGNNWAGKFENLPVYETLEKTEAFAYTIKEVGEETGKVVIGSNKYEVKYSGSMEDGFTITNKEEPTIPLTPLDPPKEDIKVEKIWQDKDEKEIAAPVDKIEVELYRDGKATGKKIELNKANKWSGEFKDLDVVGKLDSKEVYKYSVKEVGEETGSIKLNGNWYKVNYSGSMKDGFTITNKEEPKTPPTPPTPSEPDTITIKVKKDWTLYGNKPVDKIMVELYRDGKATGKILELNKANNWSGEFKNLGVKESANSKHDYHYTIKEIGEVGNTIKLDGRWFDVNYLGHMKDGFTIVNKEEKPTEPVKPEEPGKPDPKPKLPNTGEKASNAAVVAGLALMAVTGGLYFVSRKNK